jgi:DNA polymerase (family 10)
VAAKSAGAIPNAEVARLLREIGDLLELDQANPFRIRAYRNAARVIDGLTEPVAAIDARPETTLENLPGIGDDLAHTIRELASRGRVELLEKLRSRVGPGELELVQVRGLGPRKIQALRQALGIRSVPDLRRAIEQGKVREVPGFGARSEEKLRAELAARPAGEPRLLRATAVQYASVLTDQLRKVPGVRRVEVAGSFRRCRETVGDLDLLVESAAPARAVAAFTAAPGVREILQQGEGGASIRLESGLQVDLRVVPSESFGAALYYFTGSKAHNIAVRRMAQEQGLKVNEYGVFRGTRRIGGRTEQEVAKSVGLPLIPPELREDRGEIAAAQAGTLPALVAVEDLRGDLQMHTTSSDGRDSLGAMVRAAVGRGYEYVAITDHSPAVRVARGLDAGGFRVQWKAIDRLNQQGGRTRVLKSAEVDILADGSLDLDDDTLRGFDLVTVSVHSAFDLPVEKQTRRILRALRHPAVQILAHPTARLIGERAGIKADWDQVFRAAAGLGVWLEVNAQPSRLDLDDLASRQAVGLGVTLTIGSDAHSVAELDLVRWGVDQARRGWVTKKSVANAWPLATMLKRRRGAAVS